MKIKRFVAKDMRSALDEVKEFLGPDAIIMSNKKVAGGVEIVAAIDPDAQPAVVAEPKKAIDTGSATVSALAARQSALQQKMRVEPAIDDEADSLRALLARQMSKQGGQVEAVTAAPAPKPARQESRTERQNNGAHPSVSVQELSQWQEKQQQQLQSEFAAMRNEMLSMRQLLQHQVSGLMWQELARTEPVRALVIEQMKQMGLSSAMADQLACFMPEDISESEAWDTALELLAGQLNTGNNDIMRKGGVVALVGPTGVGKTTTVAKLAAQYARKHGADQVALITTDTFRIGALDQLSTFGRIIGCPVRQANDSEELALLLKQFANRSLVLIDTAGMSQRDLRLAEKLAALVQDSLVKIKSYLVLSATAQARVMQESVDHFKRIPLSGCIFTKLDECLSLGEIINAALQNALPVCYLTNGQRVPEDIRIARADDIVAQAEKLRIAYSSTAYQWEASIGSRAEGAYA
ncbi:flagellar biosynthesis protein FlhF [Alkalimonas sp. MEB108]|uniref:Flagellar biosynthesis protein FlhF n=1 Tax=Alkalimonas cellulosilytica TaxID=3058395 RepID=A0ABU7J0M8_9GAMM|nr:flagellar biosynthesis protein FlhF [Alkalimonas sp. MEB108]MEE2000055.1 flagellar biosynthesis protein FlhF [Alkalimonas sp. MEB108]